MDSKSWKHGLFVAALTGTVFAAGSTVMAADQKQETELPGAGIENVLNEYQASGEAVPIENYLVPSLKGEYLDMGFADVEEGSFLYIRSGPSKETDWIGKLYRDYAAEIVGPVGEWTQIESGNVTGYVKTEFLLTGDAAQQKAEELIASQSGSGTDTGAGTQKQTPSDVKPESQPKTENDTQPDKTQPDKTQEVTAQETSAQVSDSGKAGEQNHAVTGQKAETAADTEEQDMAVFAYAESRVEEEQRIAEEEAKAQKEAEEAVQAYVSSGQAVVNYACQFLGNPYVWGGTSLTAGADCSGFVQSVYSNFGISMPRTSGEMRYAGMEVGSYEQALPGDVFCYDGHVGIYMGNGQIVNAIDEAHGIGITNATYTNIITIRRLL